MKPPLTDSQDQEYEQILREGITADRAGHREQARKLLEKALELNKFDARPWVWLSATTDDSEKRREYLEYAVAADPSDATARRGLVLLSEKLDKSRLVPEGQTVEPHHHTQPEEARPVQAFLCPQCGGRMRYSPGQGSLVCENCGHSQKSDGGRPVETMEQPIDFVLPTTRSQRWADAQQAMKCSQCGALTLLPPAEKTIQCPYCGSNQLMESPETLELVDPQTIALMKIDARQAALNVKDWLGSGSFAPDDLIKSVRRIQLRPAYYPFWTFDGTLEISWHCEVNEGSFRSPRWVRRSGTEFDMFDDILVAGLRALPPKQIGEIEPFNPKEMVEFQPEHLAGWLALSYDIPLADASLMAREKVINKLRKSLQNRLEPGRQKRNLTSGAGKWSGLTFKHALLPLWVGTYEYLGKNYQLLINGQTGKVGGKKPTDNTKVALFIAGAVLVIAIILLGAYLFFR
jgi:DNA-directed RNA polymerase subunit RPC12/RpoP